jgi:hypothetical protein
MTICSDGEQLKSGNQEIYPIKKMSQKPAIGMFSKLLNKKSKNPAGVAQPAERFWNENNR